jgi:hypothetical protein
MASQQRGSLQEGKFCSIPDCILQKDHISPCEVRRLCEALGCILGLHHKGDHFRVFRQDLRASHLRFERAVIETAAANLQLLTAMVMGGMGMAGRLEMYELRQKHDLGQRAQSIRAKQRVLPAPPNAEQLPLFYKRLQLSDQQIRLFQLLPGRNDSQIQGSFQFTDLSTCPPYIALSYTWGDQAGEKSISFDSGQTMMVGRNLWSFLRCQQSIITRPTLFWIDAICINQRSIHERNHQVGLMKRIYANATEVYIWLGKEADNSNLAIDYLVQQVDVKLRACGQGFYPIWPREVGKALRALCERVYWRRMWIIQEVLHAQKLTVFCGAKSFEWRAVEALYLKLKTLEDTSWFAHHEFSMTVMQSAASVIVWQRAHYRHLQTPQPRLQTLIEIFRDWQCLDVRDKVFALVGMASSTANIVPDYAMSPREVYFAVMDAVEGHKDQFANMLSQILGLTGRDVGLYDRTLYVDIRLLHYQVVSSDFARLEHKVPSAERLVLKARVNQQWGPVT